MSGGTDPAFAQRLLTPALRLYPKSYRDQQGSEIAGTYTAATAGATRAEILREALDVARHGLRVRLRLTSDRYGGAVVGAALPYVLGSVAGLSGVMLYLMFRGGINTHHEDFLFRIRFETGQGSDGAVLAYIPVSVLAAASAMALSALVGRWALARWFAVATLVAAAVTIAVVFELRRGAHIYVLTTFPGFEMPLMLAAFAALVLAVPPEARALAGHRIPTIAVALAVTGMLQLAWQREGFAWSLITAMPGVVAAVLALALAAGLRNGLAPGAVALACGPWLIQPLTGDLYDYGYDGTQYVLLVALGIILVLAAGSRHHRNRMSAAKPPW
ncbi:hypothetical protein ABH926_009299 [Catenulispora sp. GP43]|uniref:hypothetical protein n=1 Tax=Catenulispora sp. GP43 TaxID=3156263 RepID=UPI003511D0EA